MPRSDLILALIKAGRLGNQDLLKSAVEAMAAEERSMRHTVLADKLLEQLRTFTPNSRISSSNTGRSEDHGGLLLEVSPRRTLQDLVIPETVKQVCSELIEEHQRRDLLRSYSLEPRSKVLLTGPPGNGKTSLAEALASELMSPLFVVRYEAVIGSFLGETSSRLRKLFDYVRSHSCVLFFDEFDTLGKERGDAHETGEIKRVVSSLLLQIDALPSHVVVVTATNHPELLDRAVWRRFQVKMNLPRPTQAQVVAWIENFARDIHGGLGVSPRTIATKIKPASFAELQEFCDDIRRRVVLRMPNADVAEITRERVAQWQDRLSASE